MLAKDVFFFMLFPLQGHGEWVLEPVPAACGRRWVTHLKELPAVPFLSILGFGTLLKGTLVMSWHLSCHHHAFQPLSAAGA